MAVNTRGVYKRWGGKCWGMLLFAVEGRAVGYTGHLYLFIMSAEGVRRPIQIEEFKQAIKELASGELDRIQREIENNIRHLTRSNQRLLAYIDKIEGKVSKDSVDEIEELDNVDASDLGLFKESLLENQLVLNNNQERIAALEQEKIFRTSGMAPAAVESSVSKTPVVEDAPQTSLYL